MADETHTLAVEVLTPEGPVFRGELVQVSARTSVGDVGVLANHQPMLAQLVPSELRLHVTKDDIQRYATGDGYMEVFANRVVVLVGEAVPSDQLDASALRQSLDDAERELAETEEGTAAHERAVLAKQRAEAFLQITESKTS